MEDSLIVMAVVIWDNANCKASLKLKRNYFCKASVNVNLSENIGRQVTVMILAMLPFKVN